MNIVCIGGGPAGLYFALLMKQHDPGHRIRVVERNRHDSCHSSRVCSVTSATRRGSRNPQETQGKRPRQACMAYLTLVEACRPLPIICRRMGSRATS